jgi:phage shock protein A
MSLAPQWPERIKRLETLLVLTRQEHQEAEARLAKLETQVAEQQETLDALKGRTQQGFGSI